MRTSKLSYTDACRAPFKAKIDYQGWWTIYDKHGGIWTRWGHYKKEQIDAFVEDLNIEAARVIMVEGTAAERL